jgi:light-regulated signal transduction histidine kinase (bacteriophytochrome)
MCRADRSTFAVRAGDLCRHLWEDAASPASSRSPDRPLAESISGMAIRENRPVLIEDCETYGGGADLFGHESRMRSAAAVPVGPGFPGAALAVYWQEPHRASARELELLTALADLVALVLDRVTPTASSPARVVVDAEPVTSASEWEQLARLIAHDLRNPLWQIRGFAELLIEDHAPAGGDEGPSSLEHLIQATDELARVIDWVVELAHVSGAHLSPRTVDLSAAARDVMALLSSSGAAAPFQWRVGEGLRAWTDPPLVRTLLEKLISNVLWSSGGGADTQVELDLEDAGDRTTFFVRGSATIVDPGQQVPVGTHRASTATRLATIRRILHRLGGELSVDEAPSGATLHFTLPGAR